GRRDARTSGAAVVPRLLDYPRLHASRSCPSLKCPRLRQSFVSGRPFEKEEAMKYMLLIHQGDTPTPRDPDAWARLSEDEQKAVWADYQAVSQTPGVSPGVQMESPAAATTVRISDGETLTPDGPFAEIE